MNELNIEIDDNTMLFYNHIIYIGHILILTLGKDFTIIVIKQKSKEYDCMI